MARSLRTRTFLQLPAPPPPGWVQFFDGFFPSLSPGTYNIGLTHTVNGPTSPSYFGSQPFVVQAPEFSIDTTIVQTSYPPSGGSDQYEQTVPFVVLTDPALPWERALVPGTPAATEANPLPWMALVMFAEGEIQVPAGSTNPLTTQTVAQLIVSDPTVLKPSFPTDWISSDVMGSQCQTITITGAAFAATMPEVNELPLLAHVRAVNSGTEGQQLLSVLLANRLPVCSSATPAAALRWYAHLVSLEGFAAYLGPNATPIPNQAGTNELQDVMLVSLYNWTFVSLPETGFNFTQLAQGLVASEQPPGVPSLALPVPAEDISSLPTAVVARLQDGYAPLKFVANSGEQSFAWYRGPFSPVVPQPLPDVSTPPTPPAAAMSADALMIYLAEQGLFDLSYAAAWNIGRNLALADANFAQAVHALRISANGAVTTLAQRMTLSHFGGETSSRVLLARDASRRRFAQLAAAGLGERWNDALGAVRAGIVGPPRTFQTRAMRRGKRPAAPGPLHVLAHPGAATAIAAEVAAQMAPVRRWLARAMLLESVPFSHLVPDPRMLPVESIRFFYIDQGWLDAFTAGAMSLAIHSSVDVATQTALRRHLVPQNNMTTTRITGMLIRSQLVAITPGLRVAATTGGAELTLLRDDQPAPSVRLTLFQGIPDTVTIAQPYRGLLFGLESNTVAPRAVTGNQTGSTVGAEIAGAPPVAVPLRSAIPGATGGVIEIATLAGSLATATGTSGFSSAAMVQWNGTSLPTTYVAPNQLTATIPAASLASVGTASVTVVDGGVTSSAATFTIEPPFSLDALSPSSVIAGADAFTLTAEGEGFASDATVQWNGTALATQMVGPSMLLAQVGATLVAAAGNVSITVLSGTATTNAITLPIVTAEPEIDALSPSVASTGSGGFTLTVTGSGFASGAIAQWNGSSLVTSFVDTGHLTAVVPGVLLAPAGTVSVTVISDGATSNAAGFTIAAAGGAPIIGSISPLVSIAGAASFTLAVEGANFADGASVQWGTTALSTTFDDSGQLTASVPATALTPGIFKVTVSQGGAMSNAAMFTVLPGNGPTVGLLVPNSASAGSAALTLNVYGGFGAGSFALQMVQAPELLSFIPA